MEMQEEIFNVTLKALVPYINSWPRDDSVWDGKTQIITSGILAECPYTMTYFRSEISKATRIIDSRDE